LEVQLVDILDKPEDFRLCAKCGAIVRYEEDRCHNCSSTLLYFDEEKVELEVRKIIDEYLEEGYDWEEVLGFYWEVG